MVPTVITAGFLLTFLQKTVSSCIIQGSEPFTRMISLPAHLVYMCHPKTQAAVLVRHASSTRQFAETTSPRLTRKSPAFADLRHQPPSPYRRPTSLSAVPHLPSPPAHYAPLRGSRSWPFAWPHLCVYTPDISGLSGESPVLEKLADG